VSQSSLASRGLVSGGRNCLLRYAPSSLLVAGSLSQSFFIQKVARDRRDVPDNTQRDQRFASIFSRGDGQFSYSFWSFKDRRVISYSKRTVQFSIVGIQLNTAIYLGKAISNIIIIIIIRLLGVYRRNHLRPSDTSPRHTVEYSNQTWQSHQQYH